MAIILKRILISIIGGTLFQLLVYSIFAIIGLAGLSIIFLWAAILFVGDEPHQTWARFIYIRTIVIALDNVVYSTLIYCLLWHRSVTREALGKPATF